MTNQEKKRWLSEYRRLEMLCDALIDERNRWMSRAEKVTLDYADMPRCSGEDRIQTAVDHLAEIDAQIGREIKTIEYRRAATVEAIQSVGDSKLRTLLRLRYIDGLTFEEISVRMHYSWRQIIRMHGTALYEIQIEVRMS